MRQVFTKLLLREWIFYTRLVQAQRHGAGLVENCNLEGLQPHTGGRWHRAAKQQHLVTASGSPVDSPVNTSAY